MNWPRAKNIANKEKKNEEKKNNCYCLSYNYEINFENIYPTIPFLKKIKEVPLIPLLYATGSGRRAIVPPDDAM